MIKVEYHGTPEEYAEQVRQRLVAGEKLDDLNRANHIAFEKKRITLWHFLAAAEVLKDEILKR